MSLSDLAVVGTLPQWLAFVVLVLGVFKLIPLLRDQSILANQKDAANWRKECSLLRQELKECEANCQKEIKELHEEIFGLRKQNIAEQISLINIIIRSVDAPELRNLLSMMESVQAGLKFQQKRSTENEGSTDDVQGA